jgi:tRNA dimethylallyltransferase
MKSLVPIIVGPTGIGKTDLSLEIAKDLPVEIVSADSRQIYKLLDIGTSKPDKTVLERIRHHFINRLDPSEYFSSGKFAKLARQRIQEIQNRNIYPLVVGGSGLYVKSLVDGIFELEINDDKIRESLKLRMRSEGPAALHQELTRVDPELASRITKRDRQRIIRGLEVYIASGKKLSDLQEKHTVAADFKPFFIGLTMNRQALYKRINERVDRMLDEGLLVEVLYLKNLGYHAGMNALNTVGYKEVYAYLDNEISYDKMVDLIKRNTRHYAKRQYTWFNRDERINWFSLDNRTIESIAAELKPRLIEIMDGG